MVNSIAKFIFNLVPHQSEILYKISQRYVDRFNNDNNSDPASNGEQFLLRCLLPKLKGGVVFDVGANVGDWASHALSIEPSIKMHCFEPSLKTFSKLAERAWPPDTALNNFGLGSAESQIELNIVDESSGLNSIFVRRGVGAHVTAKEVINVSTVDLYCEKNSIERIHFMKVDVEGYEFEVFKGMTRLLQNKRVDMIQFEYGGCNLDAKVYLVDIWELLEKYGFKFYKLYPKKLKPIEIYSQTIETFKYANYFAVLCK